MRTSPRSLFHPIDLTETIIRQEFADVYQRETLFEQGGELERVGFIDRTAATKAGLETWILNQAEENLLPEILVLEEIEKCDKDNLMALGSIMASGYIMRTNARISRVRHEVRSLIWATCNDEEALRAFRRGFIFDRFANQLYCPLPDRDTLYQILLDKVKKIPGGNPLWADKALLLADELGELTGNEASAMSPRKVISYLAGRDRLLTGEYQRDWLHVVQAERAAVA